MLNTQVVQGDHHRGVNVFLVSGKLEFVTNWLVDEVRATVSRYQRIFVVQLL